MWSDESPFTFRYSGKVRIWRLENERYCPLLTKATVKHDKKINVWGCFAASGVGHLYLVKGILEQEQYCQILIRHMIPSSNMLFEGKWLFQHDNDPKHTAVRVKRYLSNKRVSILPWPAQSPDLNPIENLWSIMESDIRDRQPENEAELFEILNTAWQNLSMDVLSALVASMPARCQAVLDARGYATKY